MANISEGIFGTKVTKQGSQGKSETDAYTLCDSQHTVWVYTTDYLNDGSITPGEDNIIVSFSGIDSAGTGCAGDILMGGLKIFIDPVDWWTTVGTGLAHEDSIIGRGSFVGDAAVDSGAAGGYVAVVDAVIDIPGNIGTIIKVISSVDPNCVLGITKSICVSFRFTLATLFGNFGSENTF